MSTVPVDWITQRSTPAHSQARNGRLAAAVAADGRPKYIIAAAAGMPANTLGGIISGRVIPTEGAKARIAEALGVTVADIFEVTP